MRKSDKQATLAVGKPLAPQDPPTVIVGIPDTVWLQFQSGQTVDFDLRHCGVFANLVIVRGKDGADIARLLGQAQSALESANFVGVADPTKQ